MPITFWTFLIGSLALAGVPPLAGFWSKDELLVVANEGGHDVLFVVLLLTALLTAFYMTRAVLMTFFGEFRGHGEPHEGPRTMTGVLVALATVTVFVGLLGAPQLGAPFGTWVFFHEIEEALFVPWIAVASTLAALLGIAIGYRLYNTYRERDPIRSLGPAYTVLTNKYYLDDLYWKGDRPAGPRRPVRGCLLERPKDHRRRRQRRRRVHQDARERGELVRPRR